MLAACALAGTSVLLFLGSGLRPIWWLTWLAPLPVLLFARRVRSRQAFAAGAAGFFLGGLNMWHYLHDVLGAPVPLILAFLGVPSCVFGFAVLAHRAFRLKDRLWAATLAPAALWTAYEYLMSEISPHGTFGNLAYTQMDCLPVLQLASVTGVWGISFLLLLAPSAAATLIATGSGTGKKRIGFVIGVVFALILAFGYWRLSSGPEPLHRVTVALIATDAERFPARDDASLRLIDQYAEEIRRVSKQLAGRDESSRPRLALLPEKIGLVSEQATARVDEVLGDAAADAQATVVAGLDRISGANRLNAARVYSPAGTVAAEYRKHHLIPGFEDVNQPGTERTCLNGPSGRWGIQICKDLDFPRLSRQYAREGAGLMLVPAWDFGVDAWLHSRMAIMRGVESGFTVVRTAKQGTLSVSDGRGRVRAETSSAEAPFSVLVAEAPVPPARTMYARFGDWFAWLDVAVLAGILFSTRRALRGRSRTAG